MDSKLNGAAIGTSSDRPSTSHLRMLMKKAENATVPDSISWTQTVHEQSAALRRDRIALTAYYLAEERGFAPGHDAEDWLLAQSQVDSIAADTL